MLNNLTTEELEFGYSLVLGLEESLGFRPSLMALKELLMINTEWDSNTIKAFISFVN